MRSEDVAGAEAMCSLHDAASTLAQAYSGDAASRGYRVLAAAALRWWSRWRRKLYAPA